MMGVRSSAVFNASGLRLSSANRIGPTVVPSSMTYILLLMLVARALLRGSVARRKRMLERGSPCPDPVLIVMRIPCLPLTSTFA